MANRKRSPSNRWIQHLSAKEAQDFIITLHHSRTVLARLQEILKQELAIVENSDAKIDDLDNTNWTYRAAARLGEKSRIKKTLELLEFLD